MAFALTALQRPHLCELRVRLTARAASSTV